MQIELISKANLTAQQTQAMADLSRAVYPPNPSAPATPNPIKWAATTWSVLVWDKASRLGNPGASSKANSHGTQQTSSTSKPPWYFQREVLVSHVGVVARQGRFNDGPVLIGGVGGVKTHPTARRRGYARAGLDHAIEFLRAEHAVDFSLLVCREELLPYYDKLGWRHFAGDLLVEQPSGTETFVFNQPMVFAGKGELPQNGVIDLCGMPW